MRGVHLFMFIVALPALVALGHDIYLFIVNYGPESLPDSVIANEKGLGTHFATLGFIWTEYAPETYETVVESVTPETWALIDLLLTQKALLAGLVFAGFFYLVLGILRLFHLWPFPPREGRAHSAGHGKAENFGRKRSSPLKYRRK